jgi:hypothetical protein
MGDRRSNVLQRRGIMLRKPRASVSHLVSVLEVEKFDERIAEEQIGDHLLAPVALKAELALLDDRLVP